MKSKIKIALWFLLVYAALCFLSLNRHSQGKLFTYHSEIWADKAGYSIYLPFSFIYDYNVQTLPDSIVEKTGYGFEIDSANHKLITKYPYGVSLLQSPFWFLSHILSPEKDGFSIYYQKSIDFAGSFYLCLGLFLLYFTIRCYRPFRAALLLSLTVAFVSGIFYYGVYETGMSHIYSFACLSALLYIFMGPVQLSPFKSYSLITILSLLYLVIRPVNLIFLIPILGYMLMYSPNVKYSQFKQLSLFQIVFLVVLLIAFALPQLLYYKYAFDSYFSNSYQKEPFYMPTPSRIAELLFAPNNGLLLYYPVIIFLLLYRSYIQSVAYKLMIICFAIYLLLYASWWSLSLGCGFGHRAFNDIMLVFFMPLCFSNKKISPTEIVVLSILTLVNVKFIFSYDTCLHHSQDWDYSEYLSVLFGEFK